jgi:hypothetical protein
LFFAGIVFQVFLAGMGLFAHPINFVTHKVVALGLHALAVALLGLAVVGKLPRATLKQVVILNVAFMVQGLLPQLRSILPPVAALHAVNALLMFWLALVIARESHTAVQAAPETIHLNVRIANAGK